MVMRSMANAVPRPGVRSPFHHQQTSEALTPSNFASCASVNFISSRYVFRRVVPSMALSTLVECIRPVNRSLASECSEEVLGVLPVPVTETEIHVASKRVIAWIRWWMRNHPQDAPDQKTLAKALGVSDSAVSAWLRPNATRLPDTLTLMSLKKLTGIPIDVLLSTDPPT